MNIDDYNKSANRIKIDPDLKEKIMSKCEQNKVRKGFNKKKLIPILAAAAVACTATTAVFADEIMGIFRKHNNLEISITEVSEPDKQAVPILKAVPKKWDENVINELFMNGKTVTESYEYKSDVNPEVVRKVRILDDDSMLCWEDGDVSWHKIDDAHYDYGFIISKIQYGKDSGEILFPETSIDGLDKQTALDTAETALRKLGISVASSEVIALDKEHLIAEDDARNENGERIYKDGEVLPEWSEEQEAYFIKFRASAGDNELPISDHPFYQDDNFADGSNINMVISKSGIEYLEAFKVYVPGESAGSAEICTAQEAADSIIENFKDINAYYPTSIEHCRLTYVPIPVKQDTEYELRPYWEFYSSEDMILYDNNNDPVQHTCYDTLFVDAQTREVNTMNIG